MNCFRVMTEKYNWTVKDKDSNDVTTFFNNHLHKHSAINQFLVLDNKTLIPIHQIIAIEKIN